MRFNDYEGAEVTESERGRCVIVPVGLVGLVAMWAGAIVLLTWDTLGGADVIGKWGLLCSAAAAAWTVTYGVARHYTVVRDAFELGKSASVAELRRR